MKSYDDVETFNDSRFQYNFINYIAGKRSTCFRSGQIRVSRFHQCPIDLDEFHQSYNLNNHTISLRAKLLNVYQHVLS